MAIQTPPIETATEPTHVNLTTADAYRLLPESNRICELINGEVVMAPAPRPKHQWAAFRLARLLEDHVTKGAVGVVFIAPFDVYLSTFEVYQPDIVVVLRENAERLTETGYQGAPTLVVEVLSPSNRRKDLVTKAAEYARSGVPEYWVVDPTDDRIHVNHLENGTYRAVASRDGIVRSVVLPGFEVLPAAIFTMPEWMLRVGSAGDES